MKRLTDKQIYHRWTPTQLQKRFDKWGRENCQKAYHMNRDDGEGANTIGHYLGFTTNQVDAMIDTWADHLGESIKPYDEDEELNAIYSIYGNGQQ